MSLRFRRALAAVLACCSPQMIAPCLAGEASAVGRTIEPFALVDHHGHTRQFADLAVARAAENKDRESARLVVVAFLGVECPLARLYAPRLQQLADQYADRGVVVLGIDANAQDSLSDIGAFIRGNQLRFPLLADRDGAIADRFGAVRNPAVFVLDNERVVRYQGRIDDQYGLGNSSGYARPEVQRRDLAMALDELLAGKPVSQPTTPLTGCVIGRRPSVEPKGAVTYARHIAPLLEARCVSCHRPGEVGPFALTDYEEVVGWAEMIREVVSEGRMPPWSANPEVGHFVNDPRLSDAEKAQLCAWVDDGCPLGNPQELPQPRQWVSGWQIAEPDQVVKITRPITVPAEGVMAYQYITVDPGWKEDKWIAAAEARPDNRAVVHHILVGVVPPLKVWQKNKESATNPASLTSYVPGSPPLAYGPGLAVFVPAESKLLFEIHYTPNGVEQVDQSYLGVVFADPATVERRVAYLSAENRKFTIPPRAGNHELTSGYVFQTDHRLLAMAPHMHLRGKSFRYEAFYPDGTSELLLDVPRYDFNWQLRYELAEPKHMPAGTKLVCTGHFDNSSDNLANPDPDQAVEFGWQTWEEMMTGFFTAVVLEEPASDAPRAAPPPDGQGDAG